MLSEYVKQARKERHMTQAELGEALFVSKQAVGKWERNEALPAPELIVKIAKYFNVSVDELLGNDPADAKNPVNHETDEAELDKNLIRLLCQLDERDMTRVQDFVQGMLAAREDSASRHE